MQDSLCCVGLAGTHSGGMVLAAGQRRAVDLIGQGLERRREWKGGRVGHASRLRVALALGGRGGCV